MASGVSGPASNLQTSPAQNEPFEFNVKAFALLLVANFSFFLSFSLYFLLPVFIKDIGGTESDIGQIMSGGGLAVRADLDELMGKDSGSVIIRAKALARKADRVEIAMTAEEVKDTISKQRKEQEKP